MTDQHPITPPPELVHQWADMLASGSGQAVFAMAAQYGADQELEACLDEIYKGVGLRIIDHGSHRELLCSDLRAARRPKPSLRELALASVKRFEESGEFFSDQMRELEFIRKALEQLND